MVRQKLPVSKFVSLFFKHKIIIRVRMKVKLKLETMASNWFGDNFVFKKKSETNFDTGSFCLTNYYDFVLIFWRLLALKKKKTVGFFQTNLSTYFLNVLAISFYFWITVNYYVFRQSVIQNIMYLNSLSIQNISYWKDRKIVPHLYSYFWNA